MGNTPEPFPAHAATVFASCSNHPAQNGGTRSATFAQRLNKRTRKIRRPDFRLDERMNFHRISLVAFSALLLSGLSAQEPAGIDFYEQRITVTFRDANTSAKASLVVLPLYNGAEWAISSRWDDNNIDSDLRMRDVMAKYGHRGTFYLNGLSVGFPADAAGIARRLLAGGNSIGSHSWTHTFLPYVNRRRMFEETLRGRIEWEAVSDTPVNSYAFSYENMRNDLEGPASRNDVAEALRRSGYLHVSSGAFHRDGETGLSVSWLLPADGLPVGDAFARHLADEAKRRVDPNISFNMHAVRYDRDRTWPQLEAALAQFGGRPHWWYCNQNEYAAYRRQYRHSTLRESRDGATLVATLRRPGVRDLGDAIPLTLEIRGVARDSILAVEADGKPLPLLDNAVRFHLPHAPGQRLPSRIGWVENDGPAERTGTRRDRDFPDLDASLAFRDGSLELSLTNDGGAPLQNVRILYRLPLEWEGGTCVRRSPTIAPGERFRDRVRLARATKDAKYASGTAFFAAQVDFAGGRLHVTCHAEDTNTDPSYPRDRFLVSGPIPDSAIALDRLPAAASSQIWRKPEASGVLDVEIVPLVSTWNPFTGLNWFHRRGEPAWHLARTVVEADAERKATLLVDSTSVMAVFVNDERVDGREITLKQGENRILLVVKLGDQYRPGNAGTFFRLADEHGRRLANLRYRAE